MNGPHSGAVFCILFVMAAISDKTIVYSEVVIMPNTFREVVMDDYVKDRTSFDVDVVGALRNLQKIIRDLDPLPDEEGVLYTDLKIRIPAVPGELIHQYVECCKRAYVEGDYTALDDIEIIHQMMIVFMLESGPLSEVDEANGQ